MENEDGCERRAKRQKTNHKSAVFEKLKQLKGKGSKNKYEVSDVDNVYEVVNEKDYSKSVMDRQDDWIVDDDGSGYVEDGRDIFDDDLDAESISQATKSDRKKRKNVSKAAVKGNIQSMLSNMPEKKKESVKLEDDLLLSDILSEINENPSTSTNKTSKEINKKLDEDREVKDYMKSFSDPKPAKIKLKAGVFKKPTSLLKENRNDSISVDEDISVTKSIDDDNDLKDVDIDVDVDMEEKKAPENVENGENAKELIGNTSIDFDDEPAAFDDDFDVGDIEEITMMEESAKAEEESMMALMMDDDDDWDGTSIVNEDREEILVEHSNDLPLCGKENEEKVFRFFWWDAYEDISKQPGVIFLFGKTYVESAQSYASCCVTVNNVERRLFLLPRPFRVDENGKETSTPVKMLDVYKEWTDIAAAKKIKTFRTRTVNKKYAFDPDVPLQSDYLEVRYQACYGEISKTLSGRTFSRIFGTTTNFLEILLLEKKIKGPCWLEIKKPNLVKNQLSWCKFEVSCLSPRELVLSNTRDSPPPLVVATLNMRTVPDKNMRNEIIMISCLVHNSYNVEKQPPNPQFQQHFCVFTKSSLTVFPPDLHKILQNYKGTRVQKMDSERALLNYFLTSFAKIDADLVVGHDLFDFHLGNLCGRLHEAKVTQWSRIGKLKRMLIPVKSNKSKELMLGRLVCDLKLSAKELIKSRSYDLDTLCETVLKLKENERNVLETNDVVNMLANSETITRLITLTMRDAGYIMRMMFELNVIPLALQITKIAGNAMSQTLQGGRAQRNEYLLLHAFDERDYICPDKQYTKNQAENGAVAAAASSKKKPTYAGGLVLDPKVGFYDKLILLMDFNSLYPSIIQEFNICFTTMSANLDVEQMLTCSKRETGILPAEIRKLVECRREVKKLMSNAGLSNDLRAQYNIRQLALKLTANSMYGCLGFQNSRFFAKHLASLITMKGRDILMHTRDLVQSMGFEVIYGDTDSIMINTNILDYNEALQFGKKIKQTVNKFYKQVELDVDGLFKYMLLLKKKKYAAVTMTKNKAGSIVLEQEHKGLDIVRRDWSMLASTAGKMILDHILSEQTSDERIENIQSILQKIANDLREGKVPLRFLIINKQLTKDPRLYTDKTALSHVLVALRYNAKGGKPLGAGDTVPYVICEDGTDASSTQRAYHVEELKSQNTLKIDINYYLTQQIHPVVSRLCEPLEGLDACQIANALGIDSSSFAVSKPKVTESNILATVPIKNYEKAEHFEFVCLICKQLNVVNKLVVGKESKAMLWLEKCCNEQCTVKPIEYLPMIRNKFLLDMKNYIEKYYEKVLICEDPLCPNETSVVPQKFVGKYPVCNVCNAGLMYRKYTERDLYEQLCYYKYLCDISKVKKKVSDSKLEKSYQKLKRNVEYFLKKSGYAVVNITNIFTNLLATGGASTETEFIYAEVDELDWN